ncbi:hypothetical protein HOA92_03825 [archaeon]|jgi:hypothetical protein|nr:hypothetical protein [archaeon]MBT6762141.1 hypothetical protein [archaeon]
MSYKTNRSSERPWYAESRPVSIGMLVFTIAGVVGVVADLKSAEKSLYVEGIVANASCDVGRTITKGVRPTYECDYLVESLDNSYFIQIGDLAYGTNEAKIEVGDVVRFPVETKTLMLGLDNPLFQKSDRGLEGHLSLEDIEIMPKESGFGSRGFGYSVQ